MQAAHRVAKNTGILYARMTITVFISLYATRLVLAALGVADFGLFNVVGGVIAMLGFLNSSMAAATQRFMSFAQGAGDFEKVKRIFNMSTLLHWGIALVILLVLEIAGYFFFNGILNIAPDRIVVAKIIYQFMVVSTLFTVISVPYEAVITSHENMMVYAILGIIEAILKLGIAFYITYSSQDHLVAYGLLMALLSIFLLVLRRIYCHRYYAECVLKLRQYYDKALLKEISGFAGWSLLGSSSSMITSYGQGVIINVFFGTAVNAAQGIALQVSGQLGTFAGTMQKALNPVIAKSEGAGNRNLMMKASMIGSKISFYLLMIVAIPVYIEMPFIFNLWLKDVPRFAIIFCQLLLIRNLVEQSYVTLTSTIAAVGNIRGLEICTAILNCLPLFVSYYFLTKNFPAYSVYIIYIIYCSLFSIIVIYFAKKTCGMPISDFFNNVIFRCLFSLFIIYFLSSIPSYYIKPCLDRLLYTISISLISFIIIVWYVGFSNEERMKLTSFMKNIKKKKYN
jgi:O-antigen/teichoic acid export membrane protein